MNDDEIVAVLANVSYKPGWKLTSFVEERRVWFRWRFEARCVKTQVTTLINSRKWPLSDYMCESEIVQTALLAALTAEEHEAREAFRYKGKRVFNPHISIEALTEVCEKEEHR
jgi:hypothetical protein